MQIEMRGIDKSFGGNAVLKGAGFLLDDGEVHALMGENGAGTSPSSNRKPAPFKTALPRCV